MTCWYDIFDLVNTAKSSYGFSDLNCTIFKHKYESPISNMLKSPALAIRRRSPVYINAGPQCLVYWGVHSNAHILIRELTALLYIAYYWLTANHRWSHVLLVCFFCNMWTGPKSSVAGIKGKGSQMPSSLLLVTTAIGPSLWQWSDSHISHILLYNLPLNVNKILLIGPLKPK